MSNLERRRPVRLVSSQAIASTVESTSIARGERSDKLPIGVPTRYNMFSLLCPCKWIAVHRNNCVHLCIESAAAGLGILRTFHASVRKAKKGLTACPSGHARTGSCPVPNDFGPYDKVLQAAGRIFVQGQFYRAEEEAK